MSVENPSLEKRIFILSKTYSLINSYFVHWQDAPNVDLDELYRDTIPKVIENDNPYDFFLTMLQFLASLNNGHTTYIDLDFLPFNRGNLGFKFRKINRQWVITNSHIDSLNMGDIIEEIDGIKVDDYYEKLKGFIFATGERGRIHRFSTLSFLFPLEFPITLEGGKSVPINQKENLKRKVSEEVTGKWIEKGKVAIIKISNFSNPNMENTALEFVENFFKSDTIILDLRENRGGSTPIKLTRKLMNKPYKWWSESTKLKYGIFNFRYKQYSEMLDTSKDEDDKQYLKGALQILQSFNNAQMLWHSEINQPSDDSYQGKVIILTDGFTVSAGEDFVMPFKDNGRATIVGETTQGSTGQPYKYDFDEKRFVIVGAKRAYFPDGTPFEGIGIKPDIEVKPVIDDLKDGKDTVLDYVLNNLLS
jgi:carboxyl-terminal processing protease